MSWIPLPTGLRTEVREIIVLALPLISANLANVAITTTDVIMIGWLGPAALAAGSLGHNLYFPMYLVGFGVLLAIAPILAQLLGSGQKSPIPAVLAQGLWVSVALSMPFGFLLWNSAWLLSLLGQDPAIAAMTQDYLRAALWGLCPAYLFVALRCFLMAHSRPRAIFLVTLAGVVVNAIGNYGLMFGNFGLPRLELVGAGISSALVHFFMFLALAVVVLWGRAFRHYAILAHLLRFEIKTWIEIFRIGLPIGLSILAESGLFAAAAILMGLISLEALAANAIALQTVAVIFMIPLGISQAATVRVGLNMGARNRIAVGQAGWASLHLGILFMFVAGLILWFGGREIIGLYLHLEDPNNLTVVAMGISLLAVAALFQVADGAQVILAGVLRGLKDTKIPMWIAVFGCWVVGFPVSAALGLWFGYGAVGVWCGLALGLTVVALLETWRFARRAHFLPDLEAG
ncbi:MAG: MATE family efflux transporter [Pseudomonadota bacterium]